MKEKNKKLFKIIKISKIKINNKSKIIIAHSPPSRKYASKIKAQLKIKEILKHSTKILLK
jgi:hypothetical protein